MIINSFNDYHNFNKSMILKVVISVIFIIIVIVMVTSFTMPMMRAPFLRSAQPQKKLVTWHMMLAGWLGILKIEVALEHWLGSKTQVWKYLNIYCSKKGKLGVDLKTKYESPEEEKMAVCGVGSGVWAWMWEWDTLSLKVTFPVTTYYVLNVSCF